MITIAAIGILAIGIVLAHNPAPTSPYPTNPYDLYTGYYGWEQRCYRYNQPYYQYQPTPSPDQDTNDEPQNPLPPQEPYQPPRYDYYSPPRYPDHGYYPRSYGRGCMGW